MSWNFEINDKTKSIVQSKILTAKVISQLRLIVFKIVYVSADDMSHLEYINQSIDYSRFGPHRETN